MEESTSTIAKKLQEQADKAKQLAPFYLTLLNLSFNEAREEFLKKHASMMHLYNGRDYANIMHAHLRGRIRANFSALPEAYFDEKAGGFKLLLDGRARGIDVFLAIKLKKYSRKYKTSNISTDAVEAFQGQQMSFVDFSPIIQNALFDDPQGVKAAKVVNLPKLHNLVAGYSIEPAWNDFKYLALTMPFGSKQVSLIADFSAVTSEQAAAVIEMPQTKTATPKRVKRRHIAPPPPDRKKTRIHLVATEETTAELNETEKKRKNDE